jgi:transcriptional regulator
LDKPVNDRPPFERFEPADVLDLIAEYPLAWLVPEGEGATPPSVLPLIAEPGPDGWPVALIGHMARRNPLATALARQPEARILFMGPQAYVSPAMVGDPDWAPTWNFAQLHIRARIRFEPERSGASLNELLSAMERQQPTGWTPDMLGGRYQAMEDVIIAFRADILSLSGRFKLGQDEKPERLAEILDRHPDRALVRWMRRFNAYRL